MNNENSSTPSTLSEAATTPTETTLTTEHGDEATPGILAEPAEQPEATGTSLALGGRVREISAEAPETGAEGEEDGGEVIEGEWVDITPKELTLPEGLGVNAERMERFVDDLNALGRGEMTIDDFANNALMTARDMVAELYDAQAAEWERVNTQWMHDLLRDPDFGNGNPEQMDQRLGEVRRLINQFGPPRPAPNELSPLEQFFEFSGAGNNPDMLKFLHNIAIRFREGSAVRGEPARTPGRGLEGIYNS